jgi:hypothetical protein
MKRPLTRRDFLRQGGAALAGAALSWRDLASGRALAAVEGSATVAGPSAGELEMLADLLAETVARLERKFPYASALFTSQQGIEITRDRQGRTSEASAKRRPCGSTAARPSTSGRSICHLRTRRRPALEEGRAYDRMIDHPNPHPDDICRRSIRRPRGVSAADVDSSSHA